MPKIFLKFNEQVLKEIPLDKPRLTIGRKPDNDLVIDNPAVSGHHALIFSQEGAFFIEDLGSTNGTFVNDAKIQKEKLKNSDRVAVGKHVLIYQDEIAAPPPPPKETESDKTMILDTAKQRELLKAAQGTMKTAAVGGKTTEKVGRLTVVLGETDRKEYELTSQLTVIGAEDTATVKLTGWFAPKNAALISRRGSAYFISTPEGAKKITVNGVAVQGQKQLQDDDTIVIAGVHIQFFLK
ncbi:MAG TPA: FHA domain-containing protein [Nitrospirales bacterium]|nr:FHA domain-containing protein [Nitrospirales bacterium]